MDWCRHWSLDFSVRILNPALWATLGCSPFSSHPARILGTRCVRDFVLLLVTLFWVIPASRSFTFIGSANSLWPCKATYTQGLGIRRWTSLGRGRHSACHNSVRTDLEAANKSRHFRIKQAWIQTGSLPCAGPVGLSSSSYIQNDSTDPRLASQIC